MENIQIFQNSRFGQIRVATNENGNPLFLANDIAKMLGYTNPREAIAKHCKSGGVTKRDTPINGVIQSVTFIDESNLYRLVMRSNMTEAELVQDWVCEEILPSIRKHGFYGTPATVEQMIADPDFAIKLLSNLKEERTKRIEAETRVETMRPKEIFADAVAASGSCLVSEMAKILNQNGVEIGQNRLFEWLRMNGYLCSKGEYYNQPTQRAMELGLFEIKKTAITKPDGTVLTTTTAKVTGKGQIYFTNKFLNRKSA